MRRFVGSPVLLLRLAVFSICRGSIKIQGHEGSPARVRDLMDLTRINSQQRVISDSNATLIDERPASPRHHRQPLLGPRVLILRFAGRLTGLQDHHGTLHVSAGTQDFEESEFALCPDVFHRSYFW